VDYAKRAEDKEKSDPLTAAEKILFKSIKRENE